MEDRVTPASASYVAPTTFNYQPPSAKEDGVRRPNMWSSTNGEAQDRAKYVEKMEEREFSRDKGAVSGSLLDRRTGLGAPSESLVVSAGFLDQLESQGADQALASLAESRTPKKPTAPPTSAEDPRLYVARVQDASELAEWERAQAERRAADDLATAKRKAKRDKKKAKKRAKGETGATAPCSDEDGDEDGGGGDA